MEESKDLKLVRIDEGKRDFLKKLAIGTAYAVPVIATFSLDSIRNKAYAQSAYGDPAVLSFRAVPATALGDYMYGQPPVPFNTFDQYTFVITYDRPMDPAFAAAKICRVYIFDSVNTCDQAPPVTNPEPSYPEECGACSLTWQWNADRTQEFAAAPRENGTWTPAQRLTIWLNHPSCTANTLYRDTHGTLLPPFIGVADLCTIPT